MSRHPRVLLLGNGRPHHVGACLERALRGLGHPYRFVDEARYAPEPPRDWLRRGIHRVPGVSRIVRAVVSRLAVMTAAAFKPDVVVVVKGWWLTPDAVAAIGEQRRAVLVNYSTDDPFNIRSSHPDIVASIPFYDVYVSPRRTTLPDLLRAGAKRVLWSPFGYDPALHFPERPRSVAEDRAFRGDVVFVGGADSDRVAVFSRLSIRSHVDIRLYGGSWRRYPALKRFARGFVFGRELRLVLGRGRIAPCLVRRANRDGHVMRTFEIPACGGFMLAERTEEHVEFFDEGRDIVCFGSDDELIDKVDYYVRAESERARVARRGHERLVRGGHTYRDRLGEILRFVERGT